MQIIIVTGSSGLIGSETAKRFAQEGLRVVGIDNDMRAQFFGAEASTKSTRDELVKNLREYEHHELDIRDARSISALFPLPVAPTTPSVAPAGTLKLTLRSTQRGSPTGSDG